MKKNEIVDSLGKIEKYGKEDLLSKMNDVSK